MNAAPLCSRQTRRLALGAKFFGDTVLATAILDRLFHYSSTVNIKGESYRIKEKKKAGFFRPEPTGDTEADR